MLVENDRLPERPADSFTPHPLVGLPAVPLQNAWPLQRRFGFPRRGALIPRPQRGLKHYKRFRCTRIVEKAAYNCWGKNRWGRSDQPL